MYRIYRRADGTCRCECRLQDSTERWDEASLEAAIKAVKHFAKFMNGTKIKRKHIDFLEPVQVVEQWRSFQP